MTLAESLQKYHEGMFGELLGIRFVEAAPERIVAELTVREELCTTPGIMHGGAIMAFADSLGGTATGLNLPPGAGTTTIESKTNFFAPGRTGETVQAECVALHRGKRTMVWQTRVTNPEGRLLALVTQTQIVLEAKQTEQETLAALFAGKSQAEQKALLARLERAGAAVYRALAADEADAGAREALLAAAVKEEENAETLERYSS
ncbi:MAG TPA: hotdog fold thioesterase [Dehalococcoidia bacterium]|nr:hotdog fold thioesterase [Dehalococcoidia bacterium]